MLRQQDPEFKRLLDSSISRINQKESSKRLGCLKLRGWRITINNFELYVQTEFAPFPSEICSPLLLASHPSRKLTLDLFTVCIGEVPKSYPFQLFIISLIFFVPHYPSTPARSLALHSLASPSPDWTSAVVILMPSSAPSNASSTLLWVQFLQ